MSDKEKALIEIQDELMQQKDTLLKDIRVIQKRKIKEMEELYDIKLKKKAFEIDLENTKQEIKKMDQQFEMLRKKRDIINKRDETAQPTNEVYNNREIVRRNSSCDSEVKIIDHKKDEAVKGSEINNFHSSLPSKPEMVKIKTNIVAANNKPPTPTSVFSHNPKEKSEKLPLNLHQGEASQSREVHQSRDVYQREIHQSREVHQSREIHQPMEVHQPRDVYQPREIHQSRMPSLLQQRQPSQEDIRHGPSPDCTNSEAASSASASATADLQRMQEEARTSFQPYKPHRDLHRVDPNFFIPPHLAHLREYKDAILIPVPERERHENPPLLTGKEPYIPDPYRQAGLSPLAYHHLQQGQPYHHYDPPRHHPDIIPGPVPIRPTPQKRVFQQSDVSSFSEHLAHRPMPSHVPRHEVEKYLPPPYQVHKKIYNRNIVSK